MTFRNLPQRQAEVFEQIAIGGNNGALWNPRTLDLLERKGLITSKEQRLGGKLPLIIKSYEIPLGIRMEWSQWCDKHLEKAQK